MNSLLLPMLFGMNVSPELIKNMMDEKAKSLDKWRLALRLLVTTILGYIFVQRASIPAVDEKTKQPVFNEEGIQKSLNASFEENAYGRWVTESILSAIDMGIELLKPSSSEAMLMTAVFSAQRPAQNTTVIQQQPPLAPGGQPIGTIPNTFNNLRMTRFAGPRAQGGVIMPDGSIVFE